MKIVGETVGDGMVLPVCVGVMVASFLLLFLLLFFLVGVEDGDPLDDTEGASVDSPEGDPDSPWFRNPGLLPSVLPPPDGWLDVLSVGVMVGDSLVEDCFDWDLLDLSDLLATLGEGAALGTVVDRGPKLIGAPEPELDGAAVTEPFDTDLLLLLLLPLADGAAVGAADSDGAAVREGAPEPAIDGVLVAKPFDEDLSLFFDAEPPLPMLIVISGVRLGSVPSMEPLDADLLLFELPLLIAEGAFVANVSPPLDLLFLELALPPLL